MEISSYEQQAQDFLKETGTKLIVKFKKYGRHFIDDKDSRNIYRITLKNKKHSFSFDFGQSINETKKHIEPTAYYVLTCLQKYDVGSLADFCSEFGYDQYNDNTGKENSKTKMIYNAVCKEFKNVSELFTEEELEKLQEIQ